MDKDANQNRILIQRKFNQIVLLTLDFVVAAGQLPVVEVHAAAAAHSQVAADQEALHVLAEEQDRRNHEEKVPVDLHAELREALLEERTYQLDLEGRHRVELDRQHY